MGTEHSARCPRPGHREGRDQAPEPLRTRDGTPPASRLCDLGTSSPVRQPASSPTGHRRLPRVTSAQHTGRTPGPCHVPEETVAAGIAAPRVRQACLPRAPSPHARHGHSGGRALPSAPDALLGRTVLPGLQRKRDLPQRQSGSGAKGVVRVSQQPDQVQLTRLSSTRETRARQTCCQDAARPLFPPPLLGLSSQRPRQPPERPDPQAEGRGEGRGVLHGHSSPSCHSRTLSRGLLNDVPTVTELPNGSVHRYLHIHTCTAMRATHTDTHTLCDLYTRAHHIHPCAQTCTHRVQKCTHVYTHASTISTHLYTHVHRHSPKLTGHRAFPSLAETPWQPQGKVSCGVSHLLPQPSHTASWQPPRQAHPGASPTSLVCMRAGEVHRAQPRKCQGP